MCKYELMLQVCVASSQARAVADPPLPTDFPKALRWAARRNEVPERATWVAWLVGVFLVGSVLKGNHFKIVGRKKSCEPIKLWC